MVTLSVAAIVSGCVSNNTADLNQSLDINDSTNRAGPSITGPNDGELITSNSVTFNFSNSGGGDGNVKLYVDGTQRVNKSFSSGNTESYSATVSGLSAGAHDFYVEYERDDGSSTSTSTRDFTVNSPPSIDSISVVNSDAQAGDSVGVSYQFSDDLGLKDYQVTVDNPSGNQIASNTATVSGRSASPQDNGLFTPSTDGAYTIEVTLADDDNLQITQTKTVTVSEPAPSFNTDEPANNTEFTTALEQSASSITFSGNINSDFSGTTILFVDDSVVGSQSLTFGGDTYSFTETVSEGSHTYTIKAASETSGSVYSSSRINFDVVDQDQTSPISSDSWTTSGFVNQDSATVEITATDSGGSGVENIYYRVNGGSYNTVAGSTATVTINNQGNNSLEYYAEDSVGNVEAANTEYVAFETANAPSAGLTKDISSPQTLQTIEFDASGSTGGSGTISSYEWDLNDDGTFDDATGVTATKSYSDNTPSDQTESVSVRVTNSDGLSDTSTITFSVDNRRPSASFTKSVTDLKVDVDASASTDQDGSISSYEWDWTNDGSFDSSGETASHTYSSDGTYDLELRVTDDDGSARTTSKTVDVSSDSTSGGGGDNTGPTEVTFTLDNVGSSAWVVEDDSTGVAGDSENPDINLEQGKRYTISNNGYGTYGAHPLAFFDSSGNVLLSQGSEGSFESDADVNWVDNDDTVSFTVTQELYNALSGYRCTIHGSMEGSIVQES